MCHDTREPTVLSRVSCRPFHLNVDRFHQPCLSPGRTSTYSFWAARLILLCVSLEVLPRRLDGTTEESDFILLPPACATPYTRGCLHTRRPKTERPTFRPEPQNPGRGAPPFGAPLPPTLQAHLFWLPPSISAVLVLVWLWVWTPPDHPKFRTYFSSSRHHFALFVSLWVSSRGILVVFENS